MKHQNASLKLVVGFISLMTFFYANAAADSSISAPSRQVHTQSLAASCAACHGSGGNPAGTSAKVGQASARQAIQAYQLAGIKPDYFVNQMNAFRSGERQATVMHHHAKGLTPQEIEDLADYFSKQTPKSGRIAPAEPWKPEQLKNDE